MKASNGSVSAPAITFASDTNIGFFRIGDDQIGITIGGVLQGYWNSTNQVVYSADAGAAAGPLLTLYRDSASPAASDILGQVSFDGEDSAGNQQQYASAQATILDHTTTSEDAKLGFSTVVAGTVAERAYVGQGVVVGSATGGDKGEGTINATAFYDDNVQLAPSFPLPGAVGLVITNNSGTPNTIIDVTADLVVASTTANLTAITSAYSVSINAGTTGANGLDTGALANNTFYHAYAIHDGSTWAGLLSTSATAPTMPGAYTYKVRLGAVKTGGSATFLRTIQRGKKTIYQVIAASTTANLPIIGSGTAGSTTIPTWVSITVVGASGAVPVVAPTTATAIHIAAFSQSNTTLMVAPNNAYGAFNSTTNPPPVVTNQNNAGEQATLNIEFVLESTAIYWANTGGAGAAMMAIGWTDKVNAS